MFRHLQIYDPRERVLVGLADAGLTVAAGVAHLVPARRAAGAPRRILLLRLERIGDLLMSAPAIAAVRRFAPDATIDLVVGSWNAPIARLIPGIDRVETLDAAWLARGSGPSGGGPRGPDPGRGGDGSREATRRGGSGRGGSGSGGNGGGMGLRAMLARAWSWRARGYDVAINFEGDIRSHLLLALSGAPVRAGFTMAGGGPLLTHRFEFDPRQHTTENAWRLVRGLFEGGAARQPRQERAAPDADTRAAGVRDDGRTNSERRAEASPAADGAAPGAPAARDAGRNAPGGDAAKASATDDAAAGAPAVRDAGRNAPGRDAAREVAPEASAADGAAPGALAARDAGKNAPGGVAPDGDAVEAPFRLAVPALARERASALLGREGRVIGLHASGGRAIKQWVPARFAEAAARVARARDATLVLTGSPGDRAIVDDVRAALPPDVPTIDLSGELDLAVLAAVLERFEIFITGDTGPMHLAAAVGTPIVAIFGPSDPARYAPRSTRHRVVRIDLPCAPCNRIRLPPARCQGHTPDCLEGITADAVVQAALDLTREIEQDADRHTRGGH